MKRVTDLQRAKIREHAVSTLAMLEKHADKSDGPLALFRARDIIGLLDDLEDAEGLTATDSGACCYNGCKAPGCPSL